jgi:FtsP/CotA-like multicopper oxidase with cupredoxin domain
MRTALLLALVACHAASHPRAPTLEDEFAGSYPPAAPTGVVRSFELVAAPAELELLDGHKLSVWAYNGQVPGPTLRVRAGDTVRVTFTNHLPEETTIHWHGVRVPNAMDGVPHITQDPIPPGGSFTYEFIAKDAGTFWFHPHVRSSEQVERGLYGVLVVEDPAPTPYTRDEVIVLDDWRLDAAGQIAPDFNTRHDLMMDGRWGQVVTANGRTDTVLHVRPGERVRLRLLDTANGRVFVPDFGPLDAKIIAVDGNAVRAPIPAAGFELAPGNRLDVELAFDREYPPIDVMDRFSPSRPNRLFQIVVDGDLVVPPDAPAPAGHVPVWAGGLDVPPAHTFHLNAEAGGPFGIAWTIDGVAFTHEHASAPAVTLPVNHFTHLRFVNDSARIHPIHIHGMFFRLLARDGAPVDEPFFRDTVLVHAHETIDLGLVPTETGVWMLHCHILEHAEAGMMTLIAVK